MNEVERKIALWLAEHDGEERCDYCIYNLDCPHGAACYGGNSVEPPCTRDDYETELLDKDALYEDINDGKWD